MTDTKQKLLTVGQLATFLQVSEETVRRYTRSGDLKCSKLGRQLRFSKEQVEEFINRFAHKEISKDDPIYVEIEEPVEVDAEELEPEQDTQPEQPQEYLNEDGDYL